MLDAQQPLTLLRGQVHTLKSHLDAVRDGDPEGVHQARVATRRIRELLPLLSGRQGPQTADAVLEAFRSVGRSLGAVRDADVQAALLRSLEAHIPAAGPIVVVLRQQLERRRLALMRATVKELEQIEIDRLLQSVPHGLISARRRLFGGWEHLVRRAISARAAGAREAIVHATGVYFPKRAHRARIAIKKFRYSTEIAAATGVWKAAGVIRELKKGQELLGHLHDRQALLDTLPDPNDAPDAAQIHLLTHLLEAEGRDLHRRYLARRQRLLDAASAAQRAVKPAPPRLWPAAASAVAASSTVLLVRRLSA
jgi:CHAD domain-containing protein